MRIRIVVNQTFHTWAILKKVDERTHKVKCLKCGFEAFRRSYDTKKMYGKSATYMPSVVSGCKVPELWLELEPKEIWGEELKE